MADRWTVTDEDGDYALTISAVANTREDTPWAMDAQDAAQMWAELLCAQEAEYPEHRTAIVTAPDGEVTRWSVTWEAVPVFHARREATRG